MRYIFLALIALTYLSQPAEGQVTVTKLFIVRHADRLPGDDLSALGLARANELRRILSLAKIDSIFSTNTIRTRKTVNPLAVLRGLPIIIYSDGQTLINRIRTNSPGKRILIAGHSDSVPDLIQKCGCVVPPSITPAIPNSQFDNMFQVILTNINCNGLVTRRCEVIHMKYGAITN